MHYSTDGLSYECFLVVVVRLEGYVVILASTKSSFSHLYVIQLKLLNFFALIKKISINVLEHFEKLRLTS